MVHVSSKPKNHPFRQGLQARLIATRQRRFNDAKDGLEDWLGVLAHELALRFVRLIACANCTLSLHCFLKNAKPALKSPLSTRVNLIGPE
jgi:hypothetical protein